MLLLQYTKSGERYPSVDGGISSRLGIGIGADGGGDGVGVAPAVERVAGASGAEAVVDEAGWSGAA